MGTAIDTSRRRVAPESIHTSSPRGSRVGRWMTAVLVTLAVLIYTASFFFDSIVRQRVLAAMNAKLVGYHTRLNHAHVQLLDGSLTLTGLVVHQDAHPNPLVADLPKMAFHIDGVRFSPAT